MPRIARIQAWACRSPVEKPVATSFGIMRNRPAVFLRLEDEEGGFGWGEVFANWPAAGAEHRVNLLVEDLAPLVLGQVLLEPRALFDELVAATRIRALQCGEPGPFHQVIAGLDIAAWDLCARRANVPVRRLLNPQAPGRVRAYASGIHINSASTMIAEARAAGFSAFKVKVGFDAERDLAALDALNLELRAGETLFADANQAWDLTAAMDFLTRAEELDLGWMEEPIPAYSSAEDWSRLAQTTRIPLAGGENIAGHEDFRAALDLGALQVLQPDIAKWGGFTGCHAVALAIREAGRRYCPHFLGGGIGLAASAHLLAASGGDELLEVDTNRNPLRDGFSATSERIAAGHWRIAPGAGLGDFLKEGTLPEELTKTVTLTREVSLDSK